MIFKIYDLIYGFEDEIESNVISNIIKKSDNVNLLKQEENKYFYVLHKKEIASLIEELRGEKTRQWEKGLFKKRQTKTFTELHILINILKILENDKEVLDDEQVAWFEIDESVGFVSRLSL